MPCSPGFTPASSRLTNHTQRSITRFCLSRPFDELLILLRPVLDRSLWRLKALHAGRARAPTRYTEHAGAVTGLWIKKSTWASRIRRLVRDLLAGTVDLFSALLHI